MVGHFVGRYRKENIVFMDGNTEHLRVRKPHTQLWVEPGYERALYWLPQGERCRYSLIPVNFDISTGTGTGTPALAKLTPFCFVCPCRDCTPTRSHTTPPPTSASCSPPPGHVNGPGIHRNQGHTLRFSGHRNVCYDMYTNSLARSPARYIVFKCTL